MTGYRAMSYRFVKTFPVLSRNFEIETEMTIHAIDKNMQVENVIIEYRDRPEGSESKLNTYADGFKVLKTIMRMFKNYKPLEFFSIIAAVLFVVGMAFFIPVLIHFLEVGTVNKLPTLIVSGFVIMTAIICWFSGIILSTLVNQHKQDFEFQTQMVTNRYKDLFPEDLEADPDLVPGKRNQGDQLHPPLFSVSHDPSHLPVGVLPYHEADLLGRGYRFQALRPFLSYIRSIGQIGRAHV